MLTADLARRFATSTIGHVDREYPHGLAHILHNSETISPKALHPLFFGSFDWHSCVHAWWQLFRLARLFPELNSEIQTKADKAFTSGSVEVELKYLQQNPSFERPYGWAWLLALHEESRLEVLDPLAHLVANHFKSYLPRLTFPVRAGTHANTAFALILAQGWAKKHDAELQSIIENWAKEKFLNDVSAPHLEPSGEDFLSPTLTEALLMQRTQPKVDFEAWFQNFLPSIPTNLTQPVIVSDRSDGRIGHLDGLNLSRAWCWRNLAPKDNITFSRHFFAAFPHLEANYMSEHWLCTFALLALSNQ